MDGEKSRERKGDGKNRKEIDFEAIEQRFLNAIPLVWGEGVETEDFTPLMRNYSENDPLEKKLRSQMRHNSGHALYFLALIAGGLTLGMPKSVESYPRAKRIIAHLLFLKQFIQPKQVRLKLTVERLYKALLTEHPETKLEWTHFIYHHWLLIRSLAKEFNCHEECFLETTYLKLRDMYLGKELSVIDGNTKEQAK